MSLRLEETLAEAETKTGPESYKYLARLVRQILMIVSRTARLLECLVDIFIFDWLVECFEANTTFHLGIQSRRVLSFAGGG